MTPRQRSEIVKAAALAVEIDRHELRRHEPQIERIIQTDVIVAAVDPAGPLALGGDPRIDNRLLDGVDVGRARPSSCVRKVCELNRTEPMMPGVRRGLELGMPHQNAHFRCHPN